MSQDRIQTRQAVFGRHTAAREASQRQDQEAAKGINCPGKRPCGMEVGCWRGDFQARQTGLFNAEGLPPQIAASLDGTSARDCQSGAPVIRS